jgi:hypothetical protein
MYPVNIHWQVHSYKQHPLHLIQRPLTTQPGTGGEWVVTYCMFEDEIQVEVYRLEVNQN